MVRILAFTLTAAACLLAYSGASSSIDDSPTKAVPLPDRIELSELSDGDFLQILQTDPLQALQIGYQRCEKDWPSYTGLFHKQDRKNGELRPAEVIRFAFRDQPYAVQMLWQSGSRKFAEGTLYVAGENQGQMLVWLPKLFGRITSIPPHGSMARDAARYSLQEFGIRLSMLRTWRAWTAAEKHGELQWKFLGEDFPEKTGRRRCFKLVRTCARDEIDPFTFDEPAPEITDANRADSVRSVTIWIDAERWLQVGTELRRADGELCGSYFFEDLQANPKFDANQFRREGFGK